MSEPIYRLHPKCGCRPHDGHIAGCFVEIEPITVICKHNTPEALTTSLFLSPVPTSEAIPEGEYALVRVGDREDVE